MDVTDRTRVRRVPHKQVFDELAAKEILSRAMYAVVSISIDGQPFGLPVACAPYGQELLLHGSSASRLFRALSDGAPACVTVTLVQGLVLARSSFESSMHYTSLMALGKARVIKDDEKRAALRTLTDHLFPERREELRLSSEKEFSATSVLAFPLNEISVKISNGQPDDPEMDLGADVWAGILPMSTVYGTPIPAENLRDGIDVPEYLSRWPINRL
jgi:hypothetical protein